MGRNQSATGRAINLHSSVIRLELNLTVGVEICTFQLQMN